MNEEVFMPQLTTFGLSKDSELIIKKQEWSFGDNIKHQEIYTNNRKLIHLIVQN